MSFSAYAFVAIVAKAAVKLLTATEGGLWQ